MRQLHLARNSGNVCVIANNRLSLKHRELELSFQEKVKNVELDKTDGESISRSMGEELDRSHSGTLNSSTDQLSLVFIFSSLSLRLATRKLRLILSIAAEMSDTGSSPNDQEYVSHTVLQMAATCQSSQSICRRHSWPAILTDTEVWSEKSPLTQFR